jgi:hypothetical protein
MRARWDDIEILRAIDAIQEQLRGEPVSASGREVMNGIAGSWVTDSALISGFAYELDLAGAAGLLTFEVADHATAYRTQNTDFYGTMERPGWSYVGCPRDMVLARTDLATAANRTRAGIDQHGTGHAQLTNRGLESLITVLEGQLPGQA